MSFAIQRNVTLIFLARGRGETIVFYVKRALWSTTKTHSASRRIQFQSLFIRFSFSPPQSPKTGQTRRVSCQFSLCAGSRHVAQRLHIRFNYKMALVSRPHALLYRHLAYAPVFDMRPAYLRISRGYNLFCIIPRAPLYGANFPE